MQTFSITMACLLMSSLAMAQESVLEFEDVKALDISNSMGNISVTGDDNISKTSVKITKTRSKEDCDLATSMAGNSLNIEQKAPPASRKQCETDIIIRVPQKNIDLKLVIINLTGDVNVQNYAGDLDVEMESGSLKVADTIVNDGKITLGRGSAKFDNIQATDLYIKANDGNVSLGFSKILDKGKVEIRNNAGNVDVTIPASAKVDASYSVTEGRMSGEASSKQAGSGEKYFIELFVPNGNFSVNKK